MFLNLVTERILILSWRSQQRNSCTWCCCMQTSSSGFPKDLSAFVLWAFFKPGHTDLVWSHSDTYKKSSRHQNLLWISLYTAKEGKKDRGWSPWLAVTLGHHGEGGIDSTHWLLLIYTSCCCCIQMDLGHPLWPVRDTAVSEVLSSWLLSCRTNKFLPTV